MSTVSLRHTDRLRVPFAQADEAFLKFWTASFRYPAMKRIAPGVYRQTARVGYRPSVVSVDTVTLRPAGGEGTDVTYERTYHSFLTGPALQPLLRNAWRSTFENWHRMFAEYLGEEHQKAVA
jgi:hypothetical protein